MQLTLWTDQPDRSAVRRLPRRTPPDAAPRPAGELALENLEHRAARYVDAAYADNTRRAYRKDWAAFERWCTGAGLCALPASPHTLELYLTHLAERGLRASTIRRARVAIGLAHGHAELDRPDRHARIRALERGICRTQGCREEGAPPLLDHELAAAVKALGHSPREDRDRAMILLGFGGAFRSSELSALDISDVRFTAVGVDIHLRSSKEDQLGNGETTEVPFGEHEETCPVRALSRWLGRVGRPSGPLFRFVSPGGTIEHQRIHPRAVTRALQRAAVRAGLADDFSSHSLRVGLATTAHLHGASRQEIQLHGRWKDVRSVDRYIRLKRVPGRRNIARGLF